MTLGFLIWPLPWGCLRLSSLVQRTKGFGRQGEKRHWWCEGSPLRNEEEDGREESGRDYQIFWEDQCGSHTVIRGIIEGWRYHSHCRPYDRCYATHRLHAD